MPDSRPHKPKVADRAKVLSAFVQAFSQTLREGKSPHHQAVVAQLHETPEGVSRLWAHNARLIMEDGIALLIDELQAELHMLDPLSPLIPERRESYSFHIQRGRMGMDGESVSTLMNRYAFPAGMRSPLYGFKVTLPDGRLELEATFRMNRLMAIGIQMSATLSVTPEGLLMLTPVEIRSGSLPIDRIMDMLGVQLGRFMPQGSESAFTVQGDAILINPVGLFPAPKTVGKLVHAEVVGSHLVMSYESEAKAIAPPLMETDAKAYIAMLGHDLLVGKITMADLCLQMVPLDPTAAWVEFSLPSYRAQLAQGESSLKFGDELLYRIPPVSELKAPRP